MTDNKEWERIGSGREGIVYRNKENMGIARKDLFSRRVLNNCSLAKIDNEDRRKIRTREELLKMPMEIMNLKLYNLVRIYDLYSDDKIGYYMEYYEPVLGNQVDSKGHKEKKLLLDFSLEYIIENYYKIEETIESLNDAEIKIGDLWLENYICTNGKIVLIDIDSYELKTGFYKLKDRLGMIPKYEKLDNIHSVFKKLIHEAIFADSDHAIISSLQFSDFFESYDFIEDIKKHNPKMTLREYLRIKKEGYEPKKYR